MNTIPLVERLRTGWLGAAALLALALAAPGCSRGLPAAKAVVQINGDHSVLKGDLIRPKVASKTCPVAIIYHGLTGNRREAHLLAVSDSLLASGIAVCRFDFNGHGESGGDFVDMTLSGEIADADSVFKYVTSLKWVDKEHIFLVGHSQGGLVAGVLAGDLPRGSTAGIALLSPAPCIHRMALAGDMFGTEFDPADVPQWIEFWGGNHLGRPYVLDAQALDPLQRSASYSGPALVVQGLDEDSVLVEESRRYPDFIPGCRWEGLEGFTHCYGEDLSVPAGMVAGFFRGLL